MAEIFERNEAEPMSMNGQREREEIELGVNLRDKMEVGRRKG